MDKLNHYDLLTDLADMKGALYREVPLGSIWGVFYALAHERSKLRREYEGEWTKDTAKQLDKQAKDMGVTTQIADVMCIKTSYTKFCVDIYEVKVTRADFLGDIKRGKYKGYLDHCHRLYFACPSGVIKKEEVPDDVGLYVRGDNGWKCQKMAKNRSDIEVPYDTMMSLLFYRQKWNRNYQRRRMMFCDLSEEGRFYRGEIPKFKNLGRNISRSIQFIEKHSDLFDEIGKMNKQQLKDFGYHFRDEARKFKTGKV